MFSSSSNCTTNKQVMCFIYPHNSRSSSTKTQIIQQATEYRPIRVIYDKINEYINDKLK